MKRRDVLKAGSGALFGAVASSPASAGRQAAPASPRKILGEHLLGPAFAGWQGTIFETTYPPGAESAAHQHPGPTFGYVISGRIKWAINGDAPRVLEPGMSFFEPMGSVHSTAANASATEPARLAIVILGKPGEPLSTPAPKPPR
jgi:quercetin dioxygenase-like cupin family protein